MHAYGGPSDIEARLASVSTPVRLVFFTQTFGCETCLAARQVVDQIAARSARISVEEYNVVLDKEKAAAYGVDRAPAIAVVADEDVGIRYYGVPAGFEVESIVGAVEMVAAGPPELSEATRTAVAALDRDVRLQVFVTPT